MDFFERLRREQVLTPAQLQQARVRVTTTGEDWASAICALELIPEQAVARLLAMHTGHPGVQLGRCVVPLANLVFVSEATAREKLVLPIVEAQGGLILAMANPDDDQTVSQVEFSSGKKILRHVAVPVLLRAAIDASFKLAAIGERRWKGKDAWKANASSEGRAAVVRPDAAPEATQPDSDEPLPVVTGIEVGADELQLVGLLDPSFETFASAPREKAKEFVLPVSPLEAPIQPKDEKVTRRAGLGVGKLVLVVDDDPELRKLVVKVLEPFGCAVMESGDGKQALAKAREAIPNLVVLDAMLPRMHGFEVCRAIKGDPTLRRTAVLMMSGVHTDWRLGIDVAEVYGADGFFEKPFRLDDFARAIRRCLMGEAEAEEVAKRRREAALATCKEAAARAKAGKRNEAADLLRAAAGKDPYSAEPHFYLGQLMRAAGDPYRAIASLERAADLRPDLEAPLGSLGELYQQLGFRKSAQAVLRRALDICQDPTRRAALEKKVRDLEGASTAR